MKKEAELATDIETEDFMPINGTDYLELYVGNAKQSAHFFKTAFGFQDHAYSGLETGSKEKTSYVLKQNKIILVLTSSLTDKNHINDHLIKQMNYARCKQIKACVDRFKWNFRNPPLLSSLLIPLLPIQRFYIYLID